jgi:hypothetical protein
MVLNYVLSREEIKLRFNGKAKKRRIRMSLYKFRTAQWDYGCEFLFSLSDLVIDADHQVVQLYSEERANTLQDAQTARARLARVPRMSRPCT